MRHHVLLRPWLMAVLVFAAGWMVFLLAVSPQESDAQQPQGKTVSSNPKYSPVGDRPATATEVPHNDLINGGDGPATTWAGYHCKDGRVYKIDGDAAKLLELKEQGYTPILGSANYTQCLYGEDYLERVYTGSRRPLTSS